MEGQIGTGAPPKKETSQKMIKSLGAMQTVTEFLTIHKMLSLNLLNKQFYNDVIP